MSWCSQKDQTVIFCVCFYLTVNRFKMPIGVIHPRNLLEEYHQDGGETIYDDGCEPLFFVANPPQFTFSSCSILDQVSLEHRLLWNWICGAAFNYAAQSQPLVLYPREVGLKIELQDKVVYLPIWKFNRDHFSQLVKKWEHRLLNFSNLGYYGIGNCVNILWHAVILAENNQDFKQIQDLVTSIRNMNLQSPSVPGTIRMPITETELEAQLASSLQILLAHPEQLCKVDIYHILSKK